VYKDQGMADVAPRGLWFATSLKLLIVALANLAPGHATATELGIKGTQFTVNEIPTFLYGISYYGGLGAPQEFARQDLDDMQRYGFNWIRVWATWTAFGADLFAVNVSDGHPREPFFDRLRWLITECDRRGMIVDVTLAKGDGIFPARLATLDQHRQVVTTLVKTLESYRNWYLDLANERNIRDKRFASSEDLGKLRDEVKLIDARRLVTASHGGDMTSDDLRGYLETARVDFITPHRPRDPDSPGQTEQTTRRLLEGMKGLRQTVPVHYQEPFRRGYSNWQPQAEDYVNDAIGAKAGGAAGWCFHNGSQKDGPNEKPRRSFDLREIRLFDQLDEQERKAIEQLQVTFVPKIAALPCVSSDVDNLPMP
jgi:hypothetical protein